MLCKRTSKNQLTIPKPIADQFPGVNYFDAVLEGDRIVLKPVKIDAQDDSSLESIRTKMETLGITGKDLEAAIRTSRRRAKP
ncbi:MAG: AbrB/MazE/SpoVT family DNA-binding domain-containing protein [Spirochaetes bacterium]|nr:AbrB/MazE/SpoVT family DNA-binding domain-containing protein [Spirochaetota bacterium]